MESLRIERKDIYTIEVNDEGETIEFDLQDIGLAFKLQRAYDKMNRAEEDLKRKLVAIDKMGDGKNLGVINEKEKRTIEAYGVFYQGSRDAMDEFLGYGACQKIFGDRNYPEMFYDLFEALQPHLEKMQIKAEGIGERIKRKYSKKDDGVLR